MSISSKPYTGSRDFYPDDMRFRNWMFSKQQEICLKAGYTEYNAPILEPLSLYLAKSSEEIVSEQLFNFKDRGDRDVAIRPEMTPTLARMVAARRNELTFPLRMYSIANFMRYERPGRGRLREFYQLNVDLLGSSSPAADAEILSVAVEILYSYGANNTQFLLKYSDRRIYDGYFSEMKNESLRELGRLLDKREKIPVDEFESEVSKLTEMYDLNTIKSAAGDFLDYVNKFINLKEDNIRALADSGVIAPETAAHLEMVTLLMKEGGYSEVVRFDPGIIRGFDYYTGLIFEINDLHPDNRRALFGGGRYDRLLGLFGKEETPAVGFGMGDVTLQNFLEIHNLVHPDIHKPSGIFISLFDDSMLSEVIKIGNDLRKDGLTAEVSMDSAGRLKKQFQTAEKKGRRYMVILGENEIKAGEVQVKDLLTGTQETVKRNLLSEYFMNLKNQGNG
jgi:histidyl-tRNA synthetase